MVRGNESDQYHETIQKFVELGLADHSNCFVEAKDFAKKERNKRIQFIKNLHDDIDSVLVTILKSDGNHFARHVILEEIGMFGSFRAEPILGAVRTMMDEVNSGQRTEHRMVLTSMVMVLHVHGDSKDVERLKRLLPHAKGAYRGEADIVSAVKDLAKKVPKKDGIEPKGDNKSEGILNNEERDNGELNNGYWIYVAMVGFALMLLLTYRKFK